MPGPTGSPNVKVGTNERRQPPACRLAPGTRAAGCRGREAREGRDHRVITVTMLYSCSDTWQTPCAAVHNCTCRAGWMTVETPIMIGQGSSISCLDAAILQLPVILGDYFPNPVDRGRFYPGGFQKRSFCRQVPDSSSILTSPVTSDSIPWHSMPQRNLRLKNKLRADHWQLVASRLARLPACPLARPPARPPARRPPSHPPDRPPGRRPVGRPHALSPARSPGRPLACPN